MMTLMREGGFAMWFILLFGIVGVGAATHFAVGADRRRLGLVWGLALATLSATMAGTAAALGAVFHALTGQGPNGAEFSIKAPEGTRVLMQGLGESMSPAIVGFALLTVMALVTAAGLVRSDARE